MSGEQASNQKNIYVKQEEMAPVEKSISSCGVLQLRSGFQ